MHPLPRCLMAIVLSALTIAAGISVSQKGGAEEPWPAVEGARSALGDSALHPLDQVDGLTPRPIASPAITVILPNGTVTNASAPIAVSGNSYRITANFTGAILDERNDSTLDGNRKTLTQDPRVPWGIEVYRASSVLIQNLTITGPQTGVLAVAAAGVRLHGDTMIGGGWAVDLEHAADVALTQIVAHRTKGVLGFHVDGLNATGNDLSGSTSWSSQIEFGSNLTFVRNQGNGSANGFYGDHASGVLLSGNNYSFTGRGIVGSNLSHVILAGNRLSASSFPISLANVSGVEASSDQGHASTRAIDLVSARFVNLTGEFFQNASAGGLRADSVHGLVLTGGSFLGCGGPCIHVSDSVGVRILQETVTGYNASAATIENSSNVTLSQNDFQGSPSSSPVAFATLHDANVLVTQNIANGARFGVEDTGSANLTVSRNDFSRTVGSGAAISLLGDHQVELRANVLTNGSSKGIEAVRGQTIAMDANVVSGSGDTAISVAASVGVSVRRNLIDNATRFGMHLDNVSQATVENNAGGHTRDALGVGFYGWGLVDSTLSGNNLTHAGTALELVASSGVEARATNGSLCQYGFVLVDDVNTSVASSQFWADRFAFALTNGSGLWIYHNNFVGDQTWRVDPASTLTHWDAGYVEGGNFWSNHTGPDVRSGPNQSWGGSDGIVDTPLVVGGQGLDRYPLAAPWVGYWINFTAVGIVGGASWKLIVNGVTFTAVLNFFVYAQFNRPGESLEYTVPLPPGYLSVFPAIGGPFLESRNSANFTLTFVPKVYQVTFEAYGLAIGTGWSLTFGSITLNSANNTIVTLVPNGGYSYLASKVSGYLLYEGGGEVFVLNGSQTVGVLYLPIAPTGGGGGSGGFTSAFVVGLASGASVLSALTLIALALWFRARRRGPPAPP